MSLILLKPLIIRVSFVLSDELIDINVFRRDNTKEAHRFFLFLNCVNGPQTSLVQFLIAT